MDKDLIRLIKEEESLWNITCESYKHKKNKWDALERVANEMKRLFPQYKDVFTLRKCYSKFRNLRTYYHRERKKQLNNKLRKLPHAVRWIHFNDMSFMDASDSYKFKSVDTNRSPIIIQFSSDSRDTSHDAIEESMDVSRMLEQGNSSSAEDQMPHEDQNGCSEFEQISPKAKKKLFKRKAGTASPNGFSKTSKTTNFKSSSKLKGTSPKLKNTKQRIAQVVPVNSNLFSKKQTVEITHDEAFANFIAKDLGKIPEGKQKEQLRFKILELIHRCKMDANLMPD